jgi:hypothetical protein
MVGQLWEEIKRPDRTVGEQQQAEAFVRGKRNCTANFMKKDLQRHEGAGSPDFPVVWLALGAKGGWTSKAR